MLQIAAGRSRPMTASSILDCAPSIRTPLVMKPGRSIQAYTCFQRRGVPLIAARYALRTNALSLGQVSAKMSTTSAVSGASSLNAAARARAAALWPSP